ncbi:hypothetical protein UA08_07418 [Talaromyces atroroseus]|uniref:Uncharacterized protein n=1 Tax=Talaromyces atroroseus TaxID=1441469 RepID=A0A225ARJ9_TALAT|nr:hypothetical protein UA08_07418 [Talaromyces atroroseus]OKL57075.1 hypothetical protein UA08_07418 [Talaromyces atroroseus]
MSHVRVKPLAAVFIVLSIIYFLISSTFSFARIFSHPHSGIPLSQSAVKTAYYNHTIEQTHEAVIPRKIHQIYHDWSEKGGNMPHKEQWMRLRDSCINRNPGWQYKPLRYYPVFVTDSNQGSLDNNILGAVPHHPFYEYVTNHIWTYSLFHYPYPYVAVMYNSGQWFFTSMWEKYHDKVSPWSWNPSHHFGAGKKQGNSHDKNQLYRVIMDNRRGAEPWVFWNEGAGLTWQDWDFSMFMPVGEVSSRIIRTAITVTIAFSLISALVLWRCLFRRRKAVKNNAQSSSSLKSVVALLSPAKGKGGESSKKEDHELV